MTSSSSTQEFPRRFDALPDIFAFIGGYFTAHQIDEHHRFSVEFAVEEIFTNMVKYHPEGRRPIVVELSGGEGELKIGLTDRGVDPFDITQAPTVDTAAELAERTPGGLGLQLTRKMMDSVSYEYKDRTRRITLLKKLGKVDV